MTKMWRFEFSHGGGTRTEIEDDVSLAIFAAECLYGRARMQIETSYLFPSGGKVCLFRADGQAGDAAARIFAGLSAAHHGNHGFRVRRIEGEAATSGGRPQ